MRNKGDWMLLVAAIVGGGGFIGVKYLLDWGYNPYQVMFGRFFVAVVCMSLVYGRHYVRITKKEWKAGGLLGLLLGATFLLLTLGLQYTTPSVNAFLSNLQAILVPLICWAAFRQKPTKSCFIAAGLTLIGVALLSVTNDFRIDLGAILSLCAALAFSLQMAFLGKVVLDCNAIHIALVENLTVTVLSCLVVAVTGFSMPPLSFPAVGSFLYVGALSTAVYFILQSVGQQFTSPMKTAVIITSESIFTAVISALFYGERMTWRGYVGCVIIFIAMLLAERPQKIPGEMIVDKSEEIG